jgi:hypothetical protein
MEFEGHPVVVADIDSLRDIQGVEMPCHIASQSPTRQLQTRRQSDI